MSDETCTHIRSVETVKHPKKRECEECIKTGSPWVHLRTCQTCGGTRCCDSSPNRHASGHAREVGHPIVTSLEPGESWSFCFVDDVAFEIAPG